MRGLAEEHVAFPGFGSLGEQLLQGLRVGFKLEGLVTCSRIFSTGIGA